jgi:hypothetical protein
MPTSSGYSGTPLAKKLGISSETTLLLLGAPAEYGEWLGVHTVPVRASRAGTNVDVVHVFVTERTRMATVLAELREMLRADAAVWVSWPKRTAKVPTDITEDVIRSAALPLGWVDIKVCAVNEVWSGLKLVVRKELRG